MAGSHGAALMGGTGDDTIVGGAGDDAAAYAQAPAGVRVDLAAAGPQDTHGDGIDTITSVEQLVRLRPTTTCSPAMEASTGCSAKAATTCSTAVTARTTYFGGDGADTLRTGPGDDLSGRRRRGHRGYADAPAPVSVDLRHRRRATGHRG